MNWEPLVKKKAIYENFTSSKNTETESSTNNTNIFVILGFTLVSLFIVITLIWSYIKDFNLFVAILSVYIFIYCVTIIVIINVSRDKLNSTKYNYSVGSTTFMMLISIMSFSMSLYKYYYNNNSAEKIDIESEY